MVNPTLGWDPVPVYGWWSLNPGEPAAGTIELLVKERIRRVDGRMIYPEGAKRRVKIGDRDAQDPDVRDAVRDAMRLVAQDEQGDDFDGTAWDARWDKNLDAAIFTSFWAADDPDITPQGYQVKVSESLISASGKVYYIEPLIADLKKAVPGVNLAMIEVPPGSPTAPAPIYAKGQRGGVAALDSVTGKVLDADGNEVTGQSGGGPFALETMQARLETGGDLMLAVVGDSTMNDINEGPRLWLNALGANRTALRTEYALFNPTTQTQQDPPLVVQEGSAPQVGGVAIDDTFDAVVADLVGSVADSGATWLGTAGRWSSDGAAATISGGGGSLGVNVGSSQITLTADMLITTDAGGAAQSWRFYIGSPFVSPTDGLWGYLNLTAAGALSLGFWKTVDGASASLGATKYGLPGFTVNNATPVAAQVVVSLDGLDARVAVTTSTGTAEVEGVITEADSTKLGGNALISSASSSAPSFALTALKMESPSETVPGQVLRVYNGAVAGATLDYAAERIALMFPERPDALIFSSGHNYGAQSPETFLDAARGFLAMFHEVHPGVPVIAASQNPEYPPAVNVSAHAARQVALRIEARRAGWDYMPLHEAFLSRPDVDSLVLPDGVHPTTGAGDTGAGLWAATMQDSLDTHALVVS